MRCRSSLARLFALALLITPAAGFAQGPRSTGLGAIGSIDLNYQISVNGSAFTDAFVLDRNPSSDGQFRWIWATPGQPLPGGAPDSNLGRFAYSVRTTFTGGTVTGFSYNCAIDDLFVGVVMNGTNLGAGCDQYVFGSTRNVTGVLAGANTLQFDFTGNGVTDGLVVQIASLTQSPPTTVPEPGTWTLVAAGLVALGFTVRRQRRV